MWCWSMTLWWSCKWWVGFSLGLMDVINLLSPVIIFKSNWSWCFSYLRIIIFLFYFILFFKDLNSIRLYHYDCSTRLVHYFQLRILMIRRFYMVGRVVIVWAANKLLQIRCLTMDEEIWIGWQIDFWWAPNKLMEIW